MKCRRTWFQDEAATERSVIPRPFRRLETAFASRGFSSRRNGRAISGSVSLGMAGLPQTDIYNGNIGASDSDTAGALFRHMAVFQYLQGGTPKTAIFQLC
jgi:hypothetical protein